MVVFEELPDRIPWLPPLCPIAHALIDAGVKAVATMMSNEWDGHFEVKWTGTARC